MNPFDIIKDLSFGKKGLIDTSNEKEYIPFITNKAFSNFSDAIFYSNHLNMNSHLDNKLQHDYYLNSLRKNKRFSKWHKKDKSEALEAIQEYYGYNSVRAKEEIGRAHV